MTFVACRCPGALWAGDIESSGRKRGQPNAYQADVMDDLNNFLEFHRSRLLAYLDGKAPISSADPGPLEYIDQVLEEWSRSFSCRALRAPCRRERAFWFALYQLEDLVENPVKGNLDPYEGILLQNLATVRELLRGWRELPDRFYATRPGEEL